MDKSSRDTLIFVFKIWWYLLMPIIIAPFIFGEDLFNSLWHNKSLLFIITASFFNAIMDCIENEHVKLTIFNRLPDVFWSKRVSWDKSKKIFGYKFDAWHISKTLFLFNFFMVALFYRPMIGICSDFVLMGFLWIHCFNGFYSNLFLIKKR